MNFLRTMLGEKQYTQEDCVKMIQQGVRALASKQDAGEDPWGPTLAKVLPAPHPATIPPSHNPMVAACFEREAGRRTEGRGTALQG
jgi:hypothetical protein